MRLTMLVVALPVLLSTLLEAATDPWRIERRRGAAPWAAVEGAPQTDADGTIMFERTALGQGCLVREFDVDLNATPYVVAVAGPGNAHWRMTAQAIAPELAPGQELVVADRQTGGTCRRNIARRLSLSGPRRIQLRFIMWGWSGADRQRLALRRIAFVDRGPECDADELTGLMLARHREAQQRAQAIRPVKREHPSLRYRVSERAGWQQKARTTHRVFADALLQRIDALDSEASRAPLPMTPELIRGDNHVWRPWLLRLQPPQAPSLRRGEGWSPFDLPGVPIETTWRVLYWHVFSHWVLGSALTDSPAFAEQARRWVLAMVRWKFWLKPEYQYFDFATSYPLQCLAHGYDIAYPLMAEPERQEARSAIAQLAHGLYLNALSGHGSIYNDLRGNHTAVTFCGLGSAGLALLGEHPHAPLWTALAEQFMLESFDEHTSGAWTESPSYGNYGVNEWLRLAELLRNVSGRDHLQHPFLKRYADCQLMICDWEGRNLGYNGGGAGQRWNHWIFFYIARELRSPQYQWLANFCVEDGTTSFMGYGDAFWWADPALQARAPTATNTGQHYADVGLSVWRSGWEHDPTVLLHQCGRKGQHKEENMNHFTLYVKGQRLLPDGLGGKTVDHNVPVIAGRSQNKWAPGKTRAFYSDEHSGYVLGDASSPYRTGQALRHLLYLRDGVLVVVDDISLPPDRDTALSFLLHPNGELALRGGAINVRRSDVGLAAVFTDRQGLPLHVKVEKRANTARATHDVAAVRQARGQTRTVTFMRFGRGLPAEQPVACTAVSADALEFSLGSERYRLGFGPGPAAEGVEVTGAELWLARFESDRPTAILAATSDTESTVTVRTPAGQYQSEGTTFWRR